MKEHPDYQRGIEKGSEALAREIDREVLASLKQFDWEETVKNINDPLRGKNEKSEGSPRK
jgi:hypothetical protein